MGFFDNLSDVPTGAQRIPDDVEEILKRQESATLLLERLQSDIPITARKKPKGVGGGRRDFRRWSTPDSVVFEIHSGKRWTAVECLDCGVPGVRVSGMPDWAGDGPVVVRLTTPDSGPLLLLATVVWRDPKAGTAGLLFEFQTDEDRELWFEGLVEALLSRHALS